MRNREPGCASQEAAQLLSTELTEVEVKMEELIQAYRHKIKEAGFHRDLAKERDNTSDELYKSLRGGGGGVVKKQSETQMPTSVGQKEDATTSREWRCPGSEVSPRNGRTSAEASRQSLGHASQP